MPSAERDDLLARLLAGDDPQLRRETLRSLRKKSLPEPDTASQRQRRTAGYLFSEWDRRVKEEEMRRAEQAARERARRKREEDRKREDYLNNLVKRIPEAWKEVEALIRERAPQSYDRAVTLLVDLRDASALVGGDESFLKRIQTIRDRHARKSTLIQRLRQAGLG